MGLSFLHRGRGRKYCLGMDQELFRGWINFYTFRSTWETIENDEQ